VPHAARSSSRDCSYPLEPLSNHGCPLAGTIQRHRPQRVDFVSFFIVMFSKWLCMNEFGCIAAKQ